MKLDALQKQLEMLPKQSEIQTDAMMWNIDAFRAEMRFEFTSLRANHQMEVSRQMMPVIGRVAVLEGEPGKSAPYPPMAWLSAA